MHGELHRGEVIKHSIKNTTAVNILRPEKLFEKIEHQVRTWGIREMWDNFAVRYLLPKYRMPLWGDEPIVLVNSQFIFKI
jgi:hypothetical protein